LPLKRYFEFDGRSRRLEYGLFFVFCLVVQTVISLIETGADPLDVGSGSGIVSGIFALAILVPSVTLTVRRLHDFNASGWWFPLMFFPTLVVLALAGSVDVAGPALMLGLGLLVLVLLCFFKPGTSGGNRFGPDPKQREDYL